MSLLEAIALESGSVFSQEFAEDVSWTPAGGQAKTVDGIVYEESETSELGDMVQMDGIKAMVNLDTPAIPGVALGDVFVVREITYRAVGIEPDGTGRTVVMLAL